MLPLSMLPLCHLRLQVCHELPAAASAAIFKEAYRLLRPGGALAVMVRCRPGCAAQAAGLLRLLRLHRVVLPRRPCSGSPGTRSLSK